MNELDNRLDKIEARLEKIEQSMHALWEIATYFAELDPIMYDSMDQRWCLGCKSQAFAYTEDFKHEDTCTVLKARALVAQKCSE